MRGTDQRAVLAIGAAAGAGLALKGLHPTGSTVVDWIVLVLGGTAAVWASASAPWWALSALAGIAAALAPPLAPLLIGLAVFVLSLAVGAVRRSQPVERAAIAGASMLVLAMARELRWFGVSTAASVALVVAVAALGVWRRPRRERRIAMFVLGAAATVAAVAVVGLVAAAGAARPDLAEGNRTARQGIRQLKAGEFERAQVSFERAADAFERAADDLDAPWVQPARVQPVVSQHRAAGVELSGAAASATRTIERQLELVDVDALRLVDSRIDVAAVTALHEPMGELQAALDVLDEAVADSTSRWLVPPARRQLDELADEIDEQRQIGDKALAALEVAPRMLGADGERVYFVMFTTPAEARGRAGCMGNWAELTITDGEVRMTAFGGHDELSRGGERPRRLEAAPPDWLARYGQFGFTNGPDGSVGEVPWQNVTISPHFPHTAQLVAELYPKSGGRHVDGVFSLDVFAIEELVGLIGPIEIDGVDRPLTGDNTARFLLLDQYQIADRTERRDLLADVALEVVDRLLADAPEPLPLGRALAPMARQGRLLAWSPDADEQALFETVGLGGELLPDRTTDGYAVYVANASANKIETFLERDVTVTRVDGPDGVVDELTIELHNTAPSSGYPDYVLTNRLDMPPGTSRLYVTVATTANLRDATIDGEPAALHPGIETGVNTYSTFVTIPSQQSTTLRLGLTPALPDSLPYLDEQPLVLTTLWSVVDTRR